MFLLLSLQDKRGRGGQKGKVGGLICCSLAEWCPVECSDCRLLKLMKPSAFFLSFFWTRKNLEKATILTGLISLFYSTLRKRKIKKERRERFDFSRKRKPVNVMNRKINMLLYSGYSLRVECFKLFFFFYFHFRASTEREERLVCTSYT